MTPCITDFAGLLLDFDGTLANTEDIHELALNTFFGTRGYPPAKKEHGKSTLHIFREWGEETGDTEEAKKYLEEYSTRFLPQFFSQHLDKIDWFEDAKLLLEKTKEYQRVLVTGSYRFWLNQFEPKLNISEQFQNMITKEDVLPDNEKPDPLAYQLAAKKLGLKPSECLAVEDSYSGIISAKQAGCTVVAIKRNLKQGFEYSLEEKGFELADHVVSSLTEIL